MPGTIKDKVAIIGMGCTKFGELWNKDIDDLIIDSSYEALNDAGVDIKDIQAIWFGTMSSGVTGAAVAAPLKTNYIPITHVENACGTGAETMRGAAFAIAAGIYDICLAVGAEKMKDAGYGGMHTLRLQSDKWHPIYVAGGTGPGRYALAATRYFSRYGLTGEDGKRMLAKISVKSHHNGARNPLSHLRVEVTEEQVINAPIIAWPLGLFDCCGVTDGGSAAVLCRADMAKSFRDDYVLFKGFGISVGPSWGKQKEDYDYTFWPETEAACKQAYAMAGIKDPRKELDMAEMHDCFSIAEAIACESAGFCGRGEIKADVDAGSFTQEGDLPVNISGGLKSFGHPIGASGGREVFEFYKQFQGKADEPSRQLKNVRLGITHNQGGHPGRFQCGVTIIGAPE